jgi:hypothetical protein
MLYLMVPLNATFLPLSSFIRLFTVFWEAAAAAARGRDAGRAGFDLADIIFGGQTGVPAQSLKIFISSQPAQFLYLYYEHHLNRIRVKRQVGGRQVSSLEGWFSLCRP